ncbi:hypothetical protein [Mucilaginibacter rubeus]|uniref:hypothetical protein n=1 Tax=Mucilaginibacter rubeus TaxID=2027860 RepID=UPI001FB7E5CC|nr:hypothetical protein [Mucilaginibacter rubeus]
MSRERIGLIRDRNALTNQLHALNHSFDAFRDSVERLKERIALATKQLGEIETQMRELTDSDLNSPSEPNTSLPFRGSTLLQLLQLLLKPMVLPMSVTGGSWSAMWVWMWL